MHDYKPEEEETLLDKSAKEQNGREFDCVALPRDEREWAREVNEVVHEVNEVVHEVNEVVHDVHYGDTLEGLSLEYSVPISRIRSRNGIDGDALYHLKTIIIPNPQTQPPSREQTQDSLAEQFTSHMHYKEKSAKVARYYLSESNWDMQAALKEYHTDLAWERSQKKEGILRNELPRLIQMREILKKEGSEIELKKRV